jgi:hypothetical protein
MKWYMARAKKRRFKGQVRLFAPIEKAAKDVTQQTISAWIRKTIVMCLKQATVPVPKVAITAHSVRKAGASLAFLRNTALDDILQAGTWIAPTTFLHYYLADVAPKVEGRYRLGPIVAAGATIGTTIAKQ